MPDMIWQVGKTQDEQECALALKAKNTHAELITTEGFLGSGVDPFCRLTLKDRLQIVAQFTRLQMQQGEVPPSVIAELLISFGLKEVGLISLVICNSSVSSPALNGESYLEVLRNSLIALATEEKRTLTVYEMRGRLGYVNVIHHEMDTGIIPLVRQHFGFDQPLRIGRKYVHTEPTVMSEENRFLPKGGNKEKSYGVHVINGRSY